MQVKALRNCAGKVIEVLCRLLAVRQPCTFTCCKLARQTIWLACCAGSAVSLMSEYGRTAGHGPGLRHSLPQMSLLMLAAYSTQQPLMPAHHQSQTHHPRTLRIPAQTLLLDPDTLLAAFLTVQQALTQSALTMCPAKSLLSSCGAHDLESGLN